MIPLRLVDLEPRFVRYETRDTEVDMVEGDPATSDARGRPTVRRIEPREYSIKVATLAEAQGVRFLCPVCFQENGGPVGTHGVEVAFEGRGVLPHQGSQASGGQPSRWHVTGTGFEDLTLTPSIHLAGDGCGWHGWVTHGLVT